MDNPWLEPLPPEGPYVLDKDRKAIDRYNDTVRSPEAKIMLGSIPESFIGNPASATVVLLNLNPGHSETDATGHRVIDLRNAMLKNLRHEPQQ